MKLNYSVLIGAMSALALTGCPSSAPPVVEAPPAASPATTTAKPKPAASAAAMKDKPSSTLPGDFGALQSVVMQTKSAVSAGDFAKAKAELEKFEEPWSKVEDGIKAKSRSSYDQIEGEVNVIRQALKDSKADAAIAGLNSLDKMVVGVAKP